MTAATLADLNQLELSELFRVLTMDGCARRLLEVARDEDLGRPPTDLTTYALDAADETMEAVFVARESCVVCGLAALPLLADVLAPSMHPAFATADGERAEAGAEIARISGRAAEILALERTALNLLGRLSGIATNTARFVERVDGTDARVFDTRKTTPGLRAFEKYAVRCGGGFNHRTGLHDAVLVKDNHLAGVATERLPVFLTDLAIRARSGLAPRFVEVEVDSLAQFDAALKVDDGLLDILLLDNFHVDDLREAVERRDKAGVPLELEASGGVTLDTIRAIAETGVDRISSGALTHGATWVDFGLDAAC